MTTKPRSKEKYDSGTLAGVVRYINLKIKHTNNIDVKAHFMSMAAHFENFIKYPTESKKKK